MNLNNMLNERTDIQSYIVYESIYMTLWDKIKPSGTEERSAVARG